MARDAEFTEQYGVVMNPLQDRLVDAVATEIHEYKAVVIRAGLNLLFNLRGLENGALRDGDTEEAAVARVVAELRPNPPMSVRARRESQSTEPAV